MLRRDGSPVSMTGWGSSAPNGRHGTMEGMEATPVRAGRGSFVLTPTHEFFEI